MTTSLHVRDLPSLAGTRLGPGPWHEVTQEQVDLFARATGDDQWSHVDPVRAAEGPFGGTVAHGYLSLSLLPLLQRGLWQFEGARMGVNYGLDKVRFPAPVRVGARVSLSVVVDAVDSRPDGSFLLHNTATLAIEGSERPGCVAQTLSLVVPA